MRSSDQAHRLHGLYVIDSVLKTSRSDLGANNVFIVRFSQRLEAIILAALDCQASDKVPPAA